MKRIIGVFAIVALLGAALSYDASACTNVLVTKGASADGSNMVSYAADSHQLFGELYFRRSGKWNTGDLRRIDEWLSLIHISEPTRQADGIPGGISDIFRKRR